MIDTHCHLLAGVDDGPRTKTESFELASRLLDAGVGTVICTPHYSRRFPTVHERVQVELDDFRSVLKVAGVSLAMELAAEVGSAAAVEASAATLRRRQLGNGYVLVELESESPAGIVELAQARLGEFGLKPVWGHPERSRSVREQPHVLDEARAGGALVQVVAPSLTGRWGSSAAVAAWGLLDSGRVDLLASDAHRPEHVRQHLKPALELVAARYGEQAVDELVETNPRRLVSDQA